MNSAAANIIGCRAGWSQKNKFLFTFQKAQLHLQSFDHSAFSNATFFLDINNYLLFFGGARQVFAANNMI